MRYALMLSLAAALLSCACSSGQPADVPGKDEIGFLRRASGDEYPPIQLFVVNADGSGLRRLESGLAEAAHWAWSPDGARVAFVALEADDGRSDIDIVVVNADGSERTNLTNSPSDQTDPAWSPDGNRIAYAGSDCCSLYIYVMNADGSAQTRLTSMNASSPSWSPDGTRIAFVSPRDRSDESDELYIMNADGSGLTPLPDLPCVPCASLYEDQPAWSPDGTRIAIVACRLEAQTGLPPCDVYAVDADGSELRNLTDGSGDSHDPAWSPDGSRIAFTSCRQAGPPDAAPICGVHVMDADGSGLTPVANGGNPAWSLDGTRIAFYGPGGIYVMNADGTERVRIADDGYDPVWKPKP